MNQANGLRSRLSSWGDVAIGITLPSLLHAFLVTSVIACGMRGASRKKRGIETAVCFFEPYS